MVSEKSCQPAYFGAGPFLRLPNLGLGLDLIAALFPSCAGSHAEGGAQEHGAEAQARRRGHDVPQKCHSEAS